MSNGERTLDDAVRKWPCSDLVKLRIDFDHDLYVALGHEIYMRQGRVIEVEYFWPAKMLRFHVHSKYPMFWRDIGRWWKGLLGK